MTDVYELALISVVIAAGYWGLFFVRRQPHGTPLYGAMQLGAAALAAIGWIGRHSEASWTGIAGAVGVGAAGCLLVLGPLARGAARWLAGNERFGAAGKLLDVADVLAPGSGAGDEKALLGAMREIRDGRIEQTVDALVAAKERAPAEARLAIDERIAMLYLAAYRWDEAIAHAEKNLFGALPQDSASAAASLRGALGVAPPVWVELLGAYGRTGDLDRAAHMLARLEDACAGRADAAIWVHRARLMFLALAGRVAAVQVLVEPRRSRHMNAAARTYWLGVAHERKGDGPAAEAAYAKARSRSRGRPRDLIDQALARLHDARPAELSPIASEVIARVEAAPAPDVARRTRARAPWATRSLVLAFLAVAAVIAIALGPSSDVGVLARAGALVQSFVDIGEWWRLVACVFVHVGGVHLIVNALGLLVIGRLAEELFGGARTLAIFALAAIAGSVASFVLVPAGVHAGSSTGIYGLLGAVFVELMWHRARYRTRDRGALAIVAVATIALASIGLADPAVDIWAHGAGLVAGVVVGAALSPNARWHAVARRIAQAIALSFVAVAAAAAVLVANRPIAASLAALPRVHRTVEGVGVTAPTAWALDSGELVEHGLFLVLALRRAPATAGGLPAVLADYTASEPTRAKSRSFDRADPAPDRIVPLPAGWTGSELVATVADQLGNSQRFRIVVAGRQLGDSVVLASVYAPDAVARAAPQFFVELLASVGE
jgi:rhomboid protease GluP